LHDKNENGFYELRNDALAARIFQKISASEIEILEVRQFIESAHYFWKKHGVLLSDDDLKYIDPFEKKLSLSEELTSLIVKSREKYNRTRTRRRNIVVSAGIIIIFLLSIFSVWALKERNRAEDLNTKVLAEKYNLLATNISVYDPTKGLRLAEYAYSLDSANQGILSNIKRIYSDNIFYTLIAKQEDAFAKQEDAITSVTFSPDGKYILTGSGDATAKLWDLNGNLLTAIKGQSNSINSVAFSPDGLSFLTGSFGTDPSARLWDLKGNLIKVFKGHTTSIFSVSFSPDEKKILTGSADQTAILWDLHGNIDQIFSGYKSYVTSVAFSPDGQNILIGMDNGSIRYYPVKMSYNNYNKIDKYEKLSSFDKLQYSITNINNIRSSDNEKELLQASEYYINEAIQSGMGDKSKYLNYAVELYNKLLKENPGKKEYLFNLLRASVYDYEANPTDQKKNEIESINDKVLSFKSIDDLTHACYTYCLICAKNDSSVIRLKIPDSFLQICSKLLAYPDLSKAKRKDISRWCSYISTDFIQKKEFSHSLKAILTAQLSDSTNKEICFLLPIAYIFNNQYDRAEKVINEYKNKSLTGIDNFKTYKEAYRHVIDLLEDRAITHPDFAKAKELLNK